MKKELTVVDMFCGGGGESTGLMQAAEQNGCKIRLTAINHWNRAIETHAANHPDAEHLCEAVEHLDPIKVIPDQKLDLLWASPECTHHSNARGGRPRSDQSRSSAWMILKWLSEIYVERVIIENVPEFLSWGPLDKNGQVIKEKKGQTFRAFIYGLRSLGYTVDWRILCAADYGVPTTRRRLFIQAVRGTKKIIWPQITHFEEHENIFALPRWTTAKDIIDWSIPCPSIFGRKKPLAQATMKRIETGIRKYCSGDIEPFLAILHGQSTARSIHKPLPTVTCSGAHYAVIQPFLARYNGGEAGANRVYSLDNPIPTQDTSNRYGIVQPFITAIGQTSAKDRSRDVNAPLSTICTKNEHCLVTPSDLDIGFRMLQPKELAAASGFPANYIFTGTKAEQVKQIGNAVPPGFAKALFNSYL